MRHYSPGANISERQALPPPVAVSTVIFTVRDSHLWMPLVRREKAPFAGVLALPGGPVTWEESLTDVAARTLRETTGLSPKYLEQLYTFGDVDRLDSAQSKLSKEEYSIARGQRIISIVYWALIDAETRDMPSTFRNVVWLRTDELPQLAFDHNKITDYALDRLRNKAEYSSVAHNLLGNSFTLSQLREVYEAVLEKKLDVGNFRRQVLASGELEETGERGTGGAHRPAKLYRYVSN